MLSVVKVGDLVLDGREVRDECGFLMARIELRGEFYVVTAPSGDLNPYGKPYRFGDVGNSFRTPEEALEILFAWRYPDLVGVDS